MARSGYAPGMAPKAIFAALFALTLWALLESWLLRHRAPMMARLGFVPLVKRRVARAAEGIAWPAEQRGAAVEIVPPRGATAGWMRVRTRPERGAAWAGAGRVRVHADGDQAIVSVTYYPAMLAWTFLLAGLFAGIIIALATADVSAVLVAIIALMWAVPAHGALRHARAQASAALDRALEPPAAPAKPERPKTKPAPTKKKKPARR